MRTEETIKDTLLRGRQVHQLLDGSLRFAPNENPLTLLQAAL